jgi:hypothetical protein
MTLCAAKLEITGEQRGGYALTVVSSVDQMCIPFKGTKAEEEREDLFEVNADDMIQARFSSETSQLGGMNIPVATLDASADDWVLVKPQEEGAIGYVLTVKVSVMERAPKNWFDVGITALGHLPWYLKAEDLYHLTKHVLKEYNISTSRPATELCSLIDHATFVVSNNVLSVRVEEGFSVMGQIDDLLERVFAASDQKVIMYDFVSTNLMHLHLCIKGGLVHARVGQESAATAPCRVSPCGGAFGSHPTAIDSIAGQD